MPKAERKSKPAKDPLKPKRGKSAFMFFSQSKRPGVVEDNPGIAFGEVGKRLGVMWGELSSEDKVPYDELAAADKTRFEDDMSGYVPSNDDKRKTPKDPNKPKRGMSAFMFFSQDHRSNVVAENPGIAFGDVGKKLGLMWGELPVPERVPYDKKAQDDKDRYEQAMKSYEKPAFSNDAEVKAKGRKPKD